MPGIALDRLILAGASFGLYLLHYPLLNVFGTVISRRPDRAMHQVLVFAFSVGCPIALAHLIEQRRAALKRALRSALVLIQRRPPRAAFDRTEALSRPALRMQTALLIPSLRG
jgi:peptidoglycan/LPS O-acetylase OafA/YrhL